MLNSDGHQALYGRAATQSDGEQPILFSEPFKKLNTPISHKSIKALMKIESYVNQLRFPMYDGLCGKKVGFGTCAKFDTTPSSSEMLLHMTFALSKSVVLWLGSERSRPHCMV